MQLHVAILDRESVTSLIKLAEVAINDDFREEDVKQSERAKKLSLFKPRNQNAKSNELGYSEENWTQRKLIIPILRIFISLCSTP